MKRVGDSQPFEMSRHSLCVNVCVSPRSSCLLCMQMLAWNDLIEMLFCKFLYAKYIVEVKV